MVKTITRKSDLKPIVAHCLLTYKSAGLPSCVQEFNKHILSHKVKFPLLEYCATLLYENIPERDHIALCDQIQPLRTIGGNVILGIILQKRLPKYFEQSMKKATGYIADADFWYVCDIIGERVFGFSLLTQPLKTIPKIRKLSSHPVNWVIRSLGAGSHYAIKKGLAQNHVATVFQLLLSMASSRDKEIRQGIGWAAKTTARFHPAIIDLNKDKIENTDLVPQWFRRKTAIGLNRHEYAQRNRGNINS